MITKYESDIADDIDGHDDDNDDGEMMMLMTLTFVTR